MLYSDGRGWRSAPTRFYFLYGHGSYVQFDEEDEDDDTLDIVIAFWYDNIFMVVVVVDDDGDGGDYDDTSDLVIRMATSVLLVVRVMIP